jgi:LPXTG-motif cell wall-anchored protein
LQVLPAKRKQPKASNQPLKYFFMFEQNQFFGLSGVTDQLNTGVANPTIPAPVKPATPTATKTNWWDVLSSATNSTVNLANSATNAIATIKNGSGSGSNTVTPTNDANYSGKPVVEKSNTGLYIGLGVGVLALSIGGYFLFKKKKTAK